MNRTYNIYCDESCHLENDHINVMALGAAWCQLNDVEEITNAIKAIKYLFFEPGYLIRYYAGTAFFGKTFFKKGFF